MTPICVSPSKTSTQLLVVVHIISQTEKYSVVRYKDSVQGHIQFNAPTIYRGIDFDGIKLEFKNGKIIDATANSDASTEALNEILDSDDGARYIGEFAIGFNPYVVHPMRDILFDKKIGG